MNRAWLSAIALVIATPAPQPAHAFNIRKTDRGATLIYPGLAIPYDVIFTPGDPAGEALSADTRRAFDTWGHALKGRIVPEYRGPFAGPFSNADTRWTVTLTADWDPRDGDPDLTSAVTLVAHDVISGVILESDIILNGEKFRFAAGDPGAFDTESVIAHEVGHAIGFDHSCDITGRIEPSCFAIPDRPPGNKRRIEQAIMYPTISVGAVRRSLGDDDLAGLAAHYAVSPTRSAPTPIALEIDCASREVTLRGEQFPANARIEARTSNGARLPITARAGTAGGLVIEGPAAGTRLDLLVHDDTTGAYGSLVDLVYPDPCAPPADAGADGGLPSTDGEGCGCRATGRQAPGTFAMMIVAMGAVLLASRRRSRALPAAAVVLIAFAHAGDAHAFKCSRVGADFGPSLVWQTRTIPWWTDAAYSDDLLASVALEQLKLSYAAWEEAECSDISLPHQGEQSGLAAGFSETGGNKNVVVFIESGWKYDPTVIAVTTNAFDTRNGQVLDSDIEINGEKFSFAVADQACEGKMDLRNTITHEVGHLLGLDHPPNTGRYAETTMFASAPPCESKKRTLHQDDLDGLCAIYPSGQETKQCYPPNGPSFSLVESHDGFEGCSTAGGSLSWISALALMLALARRRR